MTLQIKYVANCAVCGATKEGEGGIFANTGWRKFYETSVYDASAWEQPTLADCICPDCYAVYKALQDEADAAEAKALAALKKPAQETGSGTEDNPYIFVPDTLLVLAAFYCESANSEAYAYMPSDGTPKTYATWADALADMVKF